MRSTTTVLAINLFLLIGWSIMQVQAAELAVASNVDAVTVYPDGANVTRVITTDLAAGDNTLIANDFPLGLDAASLRVEGEATERLTIGAIDARPPRPVPPIAQPEIDKRIEELRDQRADLQGMIDAAAVRRKFAARFAEASPVGLGEKGEARPIAEWRDAFTAISEETAAADAAIRKAERQQREIDREIARLQSDRNIKPPSKLEVRIEVAAGAQTKATLRVSYTVRNARWAPLYDARLDTGTKERKPALELVRRAEITQASGEDWTNVAMDVSTVRIARGGSAPELPTLLVQYPQPPEGRPLSSDRGVASGVLHGAFKQPQVPVDESTVDHVAEPAAAKEAETEKPRLRAQEQEQTADISAFQVTFRVAGRVTIGASEGAKSFRIGAATIAPELTVRSAPVVTPTAFLQASFKHQEDAPLLPGRVAIYRDGAFVGTGRMKEASKDETVQLGFGADDKVKVERAVIKQKEAPAGWVLAQAKTDERSFKITVRNAHDMPMKVAIEDQLPVSENADIRVEMLPSTTAPTTTNLRDKRGVLEWAFEAKPGEVKTILFAWRVRWPKDKSVVLMPEGR